MSVDVRTKPFKDTLETVVDLAISGVDISHYTAYAPRDRLGFDVKQGKLDVTAQAVFQKERENSVARVQGKAVLEKSLAECGMSYAVIRPTVIYGEKGILMPIEGQPPSLIDVPSGCAFHPRCPYAKDICSSESPVLRAVDGEHLAACHFTDDPGFRRGEAKPNGEARA